MNLRTTVGRICKTGRFKLRAKEWVSYGWAEWWSTKEEVIGTGRGESEIEKLVWGWRRDCRELIHIERNDRTLTTSSVLVNTRNTWSKWPPRSSTGNVVQPRDRVKCGGFYPSLILRAFYGNRHNTFLMELKLQHVGKNRECRLMTECLKKEIKTFSLKLERVIVIKLPYFDVYAI